MSNKELVKNLLSHSSEDIPWDGELLAGLQVALEQAERGEGTPAEEVLKEIDLWAFR